MQMREAISVKAARPVATFFIFSLLGLPRLKIKSISPAPNSDNSGRNSIVLPLRGHGYLAQKKVPFNEVES
jgi:hypothetical protein